MFFADEYAVIVLPYLADGDAASYLAAHHPTGAPARFALVLCHHLLRALTALHADGLVHRDVKAENVLISRGPPRCRRPTAGLPRSDSDASVPDADASDEGNVVFVLSDFGLAVRNSGGGLAFGAPAGTHLTAAPEQVQHGGQAQSVDVWAVGCTFLHAVAPSAFADGRSPHELATALGAADWRRFVREAVAKAVSDHAVAVAVADLCALDPSSRPSAYVAARTFAALGGCSAGLRVADVLGPPPLARTMASLDFGAGGTGELPCLCVPASFSATAPAAAPPSCLLPASFGPGVPPPLVTAGCGDAPPLTPPAAAGGGGGGRKSPPLSGSASTLPGLPSTPPRAVGSGGTIIPFVGPGGLPLEVVRVPPPRGSGRVLYLTPFGAVPITPQPAPVAPPRPAGGGGGGGGDEASDAAQQPWSTVSASTVLSAQASASLDVSPGASSVPPSPMPALGSGGSAGVSQSQLQRPMVYLYPVPESPVPPSRARATSHGGDGRKKGGGGKWAKGVVSRILDLLDLGGRGRRRAWGCPRPSRRNDSWSGGAIIPPPPPSLSLFLSRSALSLSPPLPLSLLLAVCLRGCRPVFP